MGSSFKTNDLFGSGPHRFAVGRLGQFVVSDFAIGSWTSGSVYMGLRELDVSVTGRLVAADEAGLWTLRDAIEAELLDPPAPGTLIDLHGRTWNDMSFISFVAADQTDRGRVISIAFQAVFRDFNIYP